MFWKSITLDNYIPFSHSGNKHVHLVFDDPATAILGNNGCGKSSLLRELTPYPATRTDYGKDGKVIKVLIHNEHIFELTSDFKNPTSPHSFKKDGVEMNLSGTSDTQRDLVDEHFGINKMILDILSGKFRACSASKVERKAVFSSAYPSDLSFVLEYHKKVSSDARACGNQLKLLRNREAEVRSYLVDDVERERMESFKTNAEALIDSIDKAVLLLDSEIHRYKTKLLSFVTLNYDYTGKTKRQILDELKELTQKIMLAKMKTNIGKHMQDVNDWGSVKYVDAKFVNNVQMAKVQIDIVKEKAETLRDELNKFYTSKQARQAASGRSDLEARLIATNEEIGKLLSKLGCKESSSEMTGDLVQSTFCDTIFTKVLPHLRKWADNFHMSGYKMYTREQLMEAQSELSRVASDLVLHRKWAEELVPQIDAARDRISRLTSRSYPSDCTRVCPMRSSMESSIKLNDEQLKLLVSKKSDLDEKIEYLEARVRKLDPICKDQVKLHGDFEQHFMSHIKSFGLEAIAFGESDPYEFMNERPSEAVNRISIACTNTINLENLRSLEAEKVNIEAQLAAMSAVQDAGISAELLDELVADKELQLDKTIDVIDKLESVKRENEEKAYAIRSLWCSMDEAMQRVKDIETFLNKGRCEAVIRYESGIVEDLLKAKHDISNQLFSINKTLNSQQKYRDILDSEILPTSASVKKEKDLLETIAKGLSPNSGLPCIHLKRFINRIIARANAFIKEVWYYDMELMYLGDEDELDFSIGILIRHNSTVKDLSLLSMGQRAIVDLAINLGICVERGWFDQYPMMADEVDAALTDEHRTRLVSMISRLLDENILRQLFLVNHFAIQTGMHHCGSVVLSPEGIVLPSEYNKNCDIS